MVGDDIQTPTSLRRLDSDKAKALTGIVTKFEELQTVLRCCERLLPELAATAAAIDDLAIEAFWTLAVLSYGRTFSGTDALTEADLIEAQLGDNVVQWHRLLLQLRAHHLHETSNPREVYSVGVAQAADGSANGVAVTSVRVPAVDDVTVRQTGAIAYALCELLDQRIAAMHADVFDEVKHTPSASLDTMTLLQVIHSA